MLDSKRRSWWTGSIRHRRIESGGARVSTTLLLAIGLVAITLGLQASTAASASSTYVVLTFDDGYVNQYTLAYQNALAPHNMRATFFVNSSSVGFSKFMSWSQLTTLQGAGNDVGGKTASATDLTTDPNPIAQICNDRQALIQHGITPITFTYPGGKFNATVQGYVQACGYGNARKGGGLSATNPNAASETLPPADWLATRAYGPSSLTLADMKSLVTNASSHGGGLVQIVVGRVCDQTLDPTNYTTCNSASQHLSLTDLNAFLDWMAIAGANGGAPAGATVDTTAHVLSAADNVAPRTTIACNGGTCGATFTSSPVTVALSATDLGTGPAATRYTTDGSDPTTASPLYTGSFSVSQPTTVKFRSWDRTGNAEAVQSQLVDITPQGDVLPPSTAIQCNGASCTSNVYTGNVVITLAATDNAGGWGVDKTYYTTDGSTPTTASTVYTGSFNVSTNQTVRFFSTDLGGNAEVARSQQISVSPVTTVVSLTWDDGTLSEYTLAWTRALQPHGVAGTFFVNSGNVGAGPGFMTWSQLASLVSGGNEIGGHTVDHLAMTDPTLTTQQVIDQVCNDRAALIYHALKPVNFAYPEGAHNPQSASIVQNCGYSSARTGESSAPAFTDTLPPHDMYATKAWSPPGGIEMKLADMKNVVNSAAANGGGWLQIVGHKVCSQTYEPAEYSSCTSSFGWVSLDTLNQFLDWLGNSGQSNGAPSQTVVRTVAQALNNSPTAPPPPAPTLDTKPSNPTNTTSASFGFSDTDTSALFLCQLDGATAAPCTSPKTSSGLSSGSHTFTVQAMGVGGAGGTTSYTWTIDTVAPPTPSLTGKPANPSNDPQPSFTFSDTDATVTFECSIDGGAFSVCASPQQTAALADGQHTFSVRAGDAAGNTSQATTYTWTVKTTLPAKPTIDSKPSDPTSQSQASFSFSDTDAGISFECSIDNAAYSGCASPAAYSGLGDGQHTFAVRARDAAGNASDPTVYTWTVDTQGPPAPSLTSTPPAATASTSASFSFSDSDSGVSFECQLDGGGFSSCTSPASYSGLGDGQHSFSVRARDAAGNAGQPTGYSWIVKTTVPPAPTIDLKPADPSNQPQPAFAFSDTDAAASFQCSIDGEAFADCASPFTAPALADGSRTFAVQAVDIAGNVSTSTQYTWTIDTQAPPAPALTSTPLLLSPSSSASFGFSDSESGVAFECRLDGAPFSGCTSPAAYSGLADGQHSFSVQARDAAGNAGQPTSYSWIVKTAVATPSIDSAPSNPSNASQATFHFSDIDLTTSFQCSIDGGSFDGCSSPFTTPVLADGSHTFAVEAIDLVANTSNAAQYSWTIDTQGPPAPSLTGTPPAVTASTSASFSFSDSEAGVTFECQLEGGGFSACTSAASYSGLGEGQHTFSVRARDALGNAGQATSYSWLVKTTAPPAPSIDSKPTNPSNVVQPSFGFSDTDSSASFRCSIDGAAFTACASPFTAPVLTAGPHTFAVQATDTASNVSDSTQYSWTIDTQAPPAPSLTSTPAAVTAGTSASFGFTDSESGVSFDCKVDAAAFAPCTSPYSTGSLADGQHTFSVRARDAAGNISTTTSFSWRIDTTAPAQPTGVVTSQTSLALTVSWNANAETDLAGYNVYRATSAAGPYTKLNSSLLTTRTYQDTTAPAVTTSFYQVEAVDQLGNRSTPAQLSVMRGIVFGSATTAAATGTTSITIAKPGTTASGDVMVAAISTNGATTVTAPTGWTLVRSTDNGTAVTQAVYVRAAGSAEPSTFVWRFSSSRTASGVIATYRGVSATAPVDVSSGGTASSSTSVVGPSVTTTGAGELLIGVFGGAVNASVTPPTGMLEQAERLGGTGNTRALIELADQELTAAVATGSRTALLSKSGANVGQLIALRPAQ